MHTFKFFLTAIIIALNSSTCIAQTPKEHEQFELEKTQVENKYNELIALADAARDNKDWYRAKTKYQEASGIKPKEKYPLDQIELINDQMRAESEIEVEAAYQKIIAVANKKLEAGDYYKARALFERALSIKPSDPIPVQKIKEIDRLLEKAKK